MRGIGRLKRVYRKARRALEPGVVILMYHRIADVSEYNTPLAVAPENFERHMEYLRNKCHPIHLLELVDAIKNNRLPKRGVVVTFDDGYVDNYLQAYPVLERYSVPATVFVGSAAIDSPKGFWWDELDNIILSSADRPDVLNFSIEGEKYEWDLGPNSKCIEVRKQVNSLIRPLRSAERENVLAQLRTWAGLFPVDDPECRAMTSEELRQFQGNQLIDIGAHTKTHPLLSSLSSQEQHEEIFAGRKNLENVIGQSVESFAYPYGDFNDVSIEIVKEAGFEAACTTLPNVATPRDDLAQLPRFWVGNWAADTFKQKLEGFLSS